ncbi:MAG: murein biosynthesis integral membrane protein MurJ [Nocardioides sp.]|uniref:murein biosynthesis integral membrane protein MurJ n=1 Tax=Nocardioides sp. TaxID=35761 RepID=UPI0039E55DB9
MTAAARRATTGAQRAEDSSVLGASAVMAAGTIVSRASGFIRSALLVAAIGSVGTHADAFNLANTIPNMLYILLAGGVFNAVLVPQLVRAYQHDADHGKAYTDRIITLAFCFLGAVTVLLVLAAPLVMRIYLDSSWYQPDHDAQRTAAIAFARLCLPQVFFYGMFVLVGQVLNARGRFGPMMWAPIANNVVSILTLAVYLALFGASPVGGYSDAEVLLLGLGSTLGIAAQFLLLLPPLRAAGVRVSPRFDFRGTGLGHTLRLGGWTVLFVVVNQIAYTVVTRLASGGAAAEGTGYTIYANSFLVTQVPHSIVTVSLATALLPLLTRHAAGGDRAGMGRGLSRNLRSALSLVIPAAALLPVLANHVARLLFGYGASADQYHSYAPTLAVFAPGMVFFTVHYFMLRGFYAIEQNRTVFFIQCAVGATNVVAALVLVRLVDPEHTAPALAAAYGLSYLVGAVVSFVVLRGQVRDLDETRLLRFLIRMLLVTAVATLAAWLVDQALLTYDRAPGLVVTVAEIAAVGGVSGCMVLLGAKAMRITELNQMVAQIGRRLGRGGQTDRRVGR